MNRSADGSAGDADYGTIGQAYAHYRQPDDRIAARISQALGPARTVLNVGAGAGSYEPADRLVTPVEPSASMRAQRPPALAAAVDATAEDLPFPDDTFDAAMTTFSVHQWADLPAGLREVRRVTRGPVVILTGDPERLRRFWLGDYAPEVIDTEARRYPSVPALAEGLNSPVEVGVVPVPLDCTDGFNEAYYGRPEMLLDPAARRSCSAWSFVDPAAVERFTQHLGRDLANGTWDARYGHLRTQPSFAGSLILVTSGVLPMAEALSGLSAENASTTRCPVLCSLPTPRVRSVFPQYVRKNGPDPPGPRVPRDRGRSEPQGS